jgi:hypothetical protein
MPARRTAVDHARRQSVLARLSVVWAAALIFGLPAGAVASAATSHSARPRHTGSSAARGRHRHRPASHIRSAVRHRVVRTAAASAAPLVFGIYPGGAAGTVGPSGPVAPEDPAKRLAALERLRAPGAPFVLHIYAGYTGPGGWTVAQQVGDEIAQYTAAGFEVELVLTYRPADGGSPQDVSGFEEFVRQTISTFGSNPGFVSLQVTNEANVMGAPNASDGSYAGAEDALIGGVIAAKAATRARGFKQMRVGFNWAYAGNVDERAFWSYLGRKGGAAFVSALDWVGLDIYPGTWGQAISGSLSSGTAAAMNTALTELRRVYLPRAGIPSRVPLHVSESGYPTGPGRTPAMQVEAMRAAVDSVVAGQRTFNITDYRWFDLRDAVSASSDFQSQYGLMTDTYVPKPAFFTYQALVASLGRRS